MERKPAARSPRYSVPNIGVRVIARGAFVRGPSGKVEHAFMGDGQLTCKELERRAIETARDEGVPQTERAIVLMEGDPYG